ncbi:calpastatin [Sphingomonas sp. Leaf357]|uniref:DUF1810 domain-containing protein n=1 Tax=Sphingomonas sp. Leaf357 TaxID=1736350 RepID=UPI0006FD7839|nr:DUF1810 domain-containing protein [Sphingomonas sp. Leaf357]KQS03147.1 calpastatin [Sphingomonas sp. Leaf357]
MSGLDRFVEAQRGVYDQALAELRAGHKTSHWMWFVFPQIAGLGQSPTARHFAIRDLDEARDYLAHPLLAARLERSVQAVTGWAGRRSAEAMLGGIDAMKLRSSCTLFEAAGVGAAGGGPVFAACLDALFDGARDAATLRLIGR